MSFALFDTMKAAQHIVTFIQETYQKQGKTKAVVAVSGGIDSAVVTTMLVRALGPENVFALFLPYADQSIDDSVSVCRWNNIPEKNWYEIEITRPADVIFSEVLVNETDTYRRGNIMARVRMIMVFDKAKELDALVCGTENKSEKYLGYFTRFGDGASDLEPVQHLYKTEIRMLAEHITLPTHIIDKDPSAGLWPGQTDQEELGFSYADADLVIHEIVDVNPHLLQQVIGTGPLPQLAVPMLDPAKVEAVLERVRSQYFKQLTPYKL